MMNEFEFIASQLKPLSGEFEGALHLEDDAAILVLEKGHEFVITTDTLTAGVHYIGDEPARLIAQKCLHVNLSDIAAMGAEPYCYFLALMLPRDTSQVWLSEFCTGLRKVQKEFELHLSGGDTTSTPGPLSVNVTMVGTIPNGKALKRSTANIGDDVWVTGNIGDAAMGLRALKGEIKKINAQLRDAIVHKYQMPQPKNQIALGLRDVVSAATDVSDGLAADLYNICLASDVGATIWGPEVPISAAVATLLESNQTNFETIFSGGDDYELLFTAQPKYYQEINSLSSLLNTKVTKIGTITRSRKVNFIDESGAVITMPKSGFQHL